MKLAVQSLSHSYLFKRTELYFGYRANLAKSRFDSHNMNSEEVGIGRLLHHQLKFSLACEYLNKGYAGVQSQIGDEVWGVVYRMDIVSLILLDTLEWAGFGAYERRKIIVELAPSRKTVECWCYFVKNPVDNLLPHTDYLNAIIKSAIERKFPDSYISFLSNTRSKNTFEINHNFSLLFYGKKRILIDCLLPIYRLNDTLREKLSRMI